MKPRSPRAKAVEAARIAQEAKIAVRRIETEEATSERDVARARAVEAAEIAKAEAVEAARIAKEKKVAAERIAYEQDLREREIARNRAVDTANIAAQQLVNASRIGEELRTPLGRDPEGRRASQPRD